MTAAVLLSDRRGCGIQLAVAGDRRRYRPRSAVTPELAARMKANKGELLALLRVDPGCRSDCDRLVAEMMERVCQATPASFVRSEQYWRRLDAIHERINATRRRRDLTDLRDQIAQYESTALEVARGTTLAPQEGIR